MFFADICRFVEAVHVLTSEKSTLFKSPSVILPLNGLYVFFESGQKITIDSREYDRIVRIGINEKPDNFRSRIRGHYSGSIEGSVFRENVGWALLDHDGKNPRETYGTKKNYKRQNSGGALEREISEYFSKAFTYKAFRIDYDKLATYEKIMIAAFSVYYQLKGFKNGLNTANWLGRHSYSQRDKIRRSGLWNSEEVILLSGEQTIDEGIISSSKMNAVLDDLVRRIV